MPFPPPITVDVEVGYYLPDNYIENVVSKLDGLKGTKTEKGFILSGTPDKDVYYILPAATAKKEQAAPVVTGGIGSTIHGTTTAMEYAASADATVWTTCADGSTETGAGTWYVRYKETDTKKAGPAAEAVVIAPSYTITVDVRDLSFDTQNEGYEINGLGKTVTITNTGNSNVSFVAPTSIYYDISLSANELAPLDSAAMTITPKAGLTAGTYKETIEVRTNENTFVSVDVSFTVNGALQVSLDASETTILEGQSVTLHANANGGSGNYAYTWYAGDGEESALQGNEVNVSPTSTTTYKVVIADTIENKSATATITVIPRKYAVEVPGDFTFAGKHVGYTKVSCNRFVLSNSGNTDVTGIAVSISGGNADAFAIDSTGMHSSLAPDETTSFAVMPKEGLPAGTYTAEVNVTGETGISKTFEISFTVEDHQYESIVTEPTCTTKGYTSHICKICNHTYTDNEVDMLAHEYGNAWLTDENGHWKECKNCGTKSEEAAHTFTWIVDQEPTETQNGLKHEEFTVCGYQRAGVVTKNDSAGSAVLEMGVRTNLPLWFGVVAVSGIAAVVLFVVKRRNK